MPPPDDKEPGEPRPPANDNLESLAAALDEIAAQAPEDDAGIWTETVVCTLQSGFPPRATGMRLNRFRPSIPTRNAKFGRAVAWSRS